MHASVINFDGISSIGLYIYANDNFVLVGKEVPEKFDKELAEVFKVPIHRVTIAGTSMVGVFVAGNNSKILVPGIIFDDEKDDLTKLGINFEVLDTRLTCLGNNLLVGSKVTLANPEFSDGQIKQIGEALNVSCEKALITDINTLGSLVVLNEHKKKALLTNDATDEDIALIETKFEVEVTLGSVNMGSPYIRSGLVCNKNGFAVGSMSGGPEITNADDALGFLEDDE
ncbi:translation initiation factor IF-6 [Candidatus Woesearchaeota archaeon CG10_big_fil_rev_8_21_14_0_10_32_9]|nr:MAG: translation initiation factor IF-6 [Candidatus Woesearchaeota archaeon CG10_big_fil_rev_8_21_14_0_10_32_9]